MCCRACAGYEICRNKGKLLADDCCPECPYFNSCMEEELDGEPRQRRQLNRRTPK